MVTARGRVMAQARGTKSFALAGTIEDVNPMSQDGGVICRTRAPFGRCQAFRKEVAGRISL